MTKLIVNDTDTEAIANKLYDMAADIDITDYAETREETIRDLVKTLETIKGTGLYDALEMITEFS